MATWIGLLPEWVIAGLQKCKNIGLIGTPELCSIKVCHYGENLVHNATLKNAVFWDVTPCGFSEELTAFIIRATRIGELGTTLAMKISNLTYKETSR
jgi:hypothetical protein